MIHSLRQRHRRMFLVIALLLPAAFIGGVAARRSVPQVTILPRELSFGTQAFDAIDDRRSELFTNSRVQIRLWRERDTGRLAIGFVAAEDFVKPDLLVYWSASPDTKGGSLPADATLLGAFGAGPLLLPVEATISEGALILYSLANQEIVAGSQPTRFSAPTK
jgi:hypothetical protein